MMQDATSAKQYTVEHAATVREKDQGPQGHKAEGLPLTSKIHARRSKGGA